MTIEYTINFKEIQQALTPWLVEKHKVSKNEIREIYQAKDGEGSLVFVVTLNKEDKD